MRLIRVLLGAVVVVVVGLIALVVLLPGEKIAQLAADQVKAQTGRDLVFEGDVGISWYPVFGVSTGPVSLSNADWSEAGPMFEAESAAIGVDVMAAITGDIRITKIEAVAPVVLLEKAADGRVNWELFPAGGEAAPGASTATSQRQISLESLTVKRARLSYVDHGGDRFDLDNLDLALAWPGADAPAELSMTARPAGHDVDVTATVGQLSALMNGDVSTLVTKVTAIGGTVDFDGRVGIAPEMAGRLVADLSDATVFMGALGLGGGVPGPARFEGDVTLTRDLAVSLRKGVITGLGNAVQAEADVALGGVKPVVTANVVAGRLALGGAEGEADAPVSGAGGWSKAPIDASALALIDGQIEFGAEAIDLGDMVIGRTRATVKIDNARAVATLHELQAYDGVVTGSFVANNRSGLSVRGDLNVAQIALKGLLGASAGIDRFTGKADVVASFLSSGASQYDIMNALSGSGNVAVGRGTIEGIDLDKLFRGDTSGGTTVFDSMSASWSIKGGVLRNEDLLMELPRIVASGIGDIGLGQRVLDYTFTPKLRSEDGSGLAVPVRIDGSWDNPRIAPDLDALLKQNLDEERKALEEEAKKKLEEELGIVKEEGQSTEDAVKKKLEEEASKGLLKLLGNN
ncbi:AsmA family protein [Shimia abyssi]|uniref:AsmA protein n=1 Tax=Shimia abyssi TaxID=1662395 RepID=A0A2P8FDB3_9RHOB|nr:AsmA family protein [Shimia abyssi]PSL19709.1 AsmA protein [Shimia abyssi]